MSESKTAKCPDCGGVVSTSAETCPHCGKPLRSKESGCMIPLVFVAILVAIVVWSKNRDPVSAAEPAQTAEQTETKEIKPAVAFAEVYLELQNRDRFDWHNLTVRIDGEFSARVPKLGSGEFHAMTYAAFKNPAGVSFQETGREAANISVSSDEGFAMIFR